MRQSSYTISYVIYPPNYKPGDGYVKRKNYKAALRQAKKWGVGSLISRWVEVQHKSPRHVGSIQSWSQNQHVYEHEDLQSTAKSRTFCNHPERDVI